MKILEETIIKPLPSEELIAKKESNWRVNLPASFKEFISKYNGAELEEQLFIHNGTRYELVRFLGIIENIHSSDLGWYDIGVVSSPICERLTDNEDLLGMELVPIAEIHYKNYLCLDFRNKNIEPSVCIWFNEESEEFSPLTEKIADSFESFLNILTN